MDGFPNDIIRTALRPNGYDNQIEGLQYVQCDNRASYQLAQAQMLSANQAALMRGLGNWPQATVAPAMSDRDRELSEGTLR